jgi:hypothetical protein
VGGYTFGGGSIDGIALTSNAPGSPALAFTLDTVTGADHVSGTDFAAINSCEWFYFANWSWNAVRYSVRYDDKRGSRRYSNLPLLGT